MEIKIKNHLELRSSETAIIYLYGQLREIGFQMFTFSALVFL